MATVDAPTIPLGPGETYRQDDVLVNLPLNASLAVNRASQHGAHVAASAGKSMGNCVATGHAAGLAAAMSAQQGIMPRDVKVTDLQDALRRDKVDLTMGGRIQEHVTSDRKA